jgi:hypothetical protein
MCVCGKLRRCALPYPGLQCRYFREELVSKVVQIRSTQVCQLKFNMFVYFQDTIRRHKAR